MIALAPLVQLPASITVISFFSSLSSTWIFVIPLRHLIHLSSYSTYRPAYICINHKRAQRNLTIPSIPPRPLALSKYKHDSARRQPAPFGHILLRIHLQLVDQDRLCSGLTCEAVPSGERATNTEWWDLAIQLVRKLSLGTRPTPLVIGVCASSTFWSKPDCTRLTASNRPICHRSKRAERRESDTAA
ncbi:hypothetical protein GGR57DRAFT_42902 [Xylariaceae sp. FL1272]|nr:hypothetical protein GGR57DRAFT_42902 [Xylariaceae sp. FL1272]